MIKFFSVGKKGQEKYDNQERVIGTWFGKSLYRKVIKLTKEEYTLLANDGNRKILSLGFNVDLILRADMTVDYLDSDNINVKTYGMRSVGTGNYEVGVHNCVNNNLQIYIGSNTLNGLNNYIYITLEYTKATD